MVGRNKDRIPSGRRVGRASVCHNGLSQTLRHIRAYSFHVEMIINDRRRIRELRVEDIVEIIILSSPYVNADD
jgi:hypothetical protein